MELDYFFLALGWIAIGVIAYTVYLNTLVDVKLPHSETPAVANARFLFFSSTHCPWSKKAHPKWEAFVNDQKTSPATFGGRTVLLDEIDGDSHPDMLKAHDVHAYPSFKLVVDGKTTEMKTVPSPDAFRDFLVKSLGAEEHTKLPASAK